MSVGLMNVTSNGARGKPIPFLLRAPRDRAGRGGATVEAAFDRDDLRAAGHLERELQRVLVRFRARVDEEDRVEAEPAEFREPRRRATAHVERHRIALEAKRRAPAPSQRLDPARMAIAKRRHGMTAVEIEHFAAAGRVQVHAARVAHFEMELREHRRQVIRQGALR